MPICRRLYLTLCTGQLWFIKRVCLPQGTYLCLNSTASLAVLASIYCAIAIPAMWLQAMRALPELFDHLQLLTLLADGFLILAGWTECWGCCFSSISFQQGGVYALTRQSWYTAYASGYVQTLHKENVQPSTKSSRYSSLRSTSHLYCRLLTAHRPSRQSQYCCYSSVKGHVGDAIRSQRDMDRRQDGHQNRR